MSSGTMRGAVGSKEGECARGLGSVTFAKEWRVTAERPVVGVVYDLGAASPLEIAGAARNLCDIVFVLDSRQPRIAQMRPVLEAIAPCCDIGPQAENQPAALHEAHLTHLTTFSERQLSTTALLASSAGLTYRGPAASGPFTDKSVQRGALRSRAVDSIRWRPVNSGADLDAAVQAVGLPCVLKPRSGAGSVHTYKLQTAHDVTTVSGEGIPYESTPMIVETLLEGDPTVAGREWGDYVSVETVSDGLTPTQHFVTGKFPLAEPYREQGNIYPSTLSGDVRGQVCDLADRALEALDFRIGVSHTEIKLTPDGPRIIEVNGRVGGFVWQQIMEHNGLNLIRVSLEIAVGRSATHPQIAGSNCVNFLRVFQPPVRARQLTSAGRVPRTGDIPGIGKVQLLRRPGSAVNWREGSQGMVALVYGHAPHHEAVLDLVRVVEQELDLTYSCDEDDSF